MADANEDQLTDAEITEGLHAAIHYIRTRDEGSFSAWVNAMGGEGKSNDVSAFWQAFKLALPRLEKML